MVDFERMKKVLALVLAAIFTHALSAGATTPATCSITGTVYDQGAFPVSYATIYFNSLTTQVVNGGVIYPVIKTSTTDVSGNLSTTALVQGVYVQITICQTFGGGCGAPITGFVPIATTTTFQNLIAGSVVSSSSSLSGNLNAMGFRITNLGADTTTGDALSRGQSTLASLGAATGNYAMGGFKFTGLGAGTGSGDSLAYGLNSLNSLAAATGNYSMGSNTLTSVAAPILSGEPEVEGSAIGATTPAAGTFTGAYILDELTGDPQTLAESGGTLSPTHPTLNDGPDVVVTIADNNNFTIANPVGSVSSTTVAHWWMRIVNNVGGSAGTITLGANYRSDSSFGSPASGKTRVCSVLTAFNGSGTISYIGPCTGDETN